MPGEKPKKKAAPKKAAAAKPKKAAAPKKPKAAAPKKKATPKKAAAPKAKKTGAPPHCIVSRKTKGQQGDKQCSRATAAAAPGASKLSGALQLGTLRGLGSCSPAATAV